MEKISTALLYPGRQMKRKHERIINQFLKQYGNNDREVYDDLVKNNRATSSYIPFLSMRNCFREEFIGLIFYMCRRDFSFSKFVSSNFEIEKKPLFSIYLYKSGCSRIFEFSYTIIKMNKRYLKIKLDKSGKTLIYNTISKVLVKEFNCYDKFSMLPHRNIEVNLYPIIRRE